jgi:endonuclease-3 related protein
MKIRPVPLMKVYEDLYAHFGPQHWWPGRTRFEVCVGAVLTQNTSWTNVEKAIRRLKEEKALGVKALHEVPEPLLAEWLRPVGYFNVKARRLKAFIAMIVTRFDGSIPRMFACDTDTLRRILLETPGVGPETADSMLLYAGNRPVFVVDAYTRRFLVRHGWVHADASYDEIAELFVRVLPSDVALYNEYHALMVALGKYHCRSKPHCETCPLKHLLPGDGPLQM